MDYTNLVPPKARVRSLVWSAALGIVIGFFIQVFLAFYGWLPYESGAWWGGFVTASAVTIILSLTRRRAQSPNIRLRPSFALSLFPLLVAGALSQPEPASAQSDTGKCDAVVTVYYHDDGTDTEETERLSETRPDRPFVVRADSVKRIGIEWTVKTDKEIKNRDWNIATILAGKKVNLPAFVDRTATSSDYDGSLSLSRKELLIPDYVVPGRYTLVGTIDGICSETAYITIERNWMPRVREPSTDLGLSPLVPNLGPDVPLGGGNRIPFSELLFPLALFALPALAPVGPGERFTSWVTDRPDQVELKVLDRNTGEVQRGNLVTGIEYVAEVTINYPDPPGYYSGCPPVEVGFSFDTNVDNALQALSPELGQKDARFLFSIPGEGQASPRAFVDIYVNGLIVDSLVFRINQNNRKKTRWRFAQAEVVYRATNFAANHINAIKSTYGCILVRPREGGQKLDIVVSHCRGEDGSADEGAPGSSNGIGPSTGRYRIAGRTCITRDIDKIKKWTDEYNELLADAMFDGDESSEPPDRILDLAEVGSKLRDLIVGTELKDAPRFASLVVAPACDAAEWVVFPWAGFTDGYDDTYLTSTCTHFHENPGSCCEPEDKAFCPGSFWGLRYDISVPNNWSPTLPPPLRYTLMSILGDVSGQLRSRLTKSAGRPNRVAIKALVAREIQGNDGLTELKDCIFEPSRYVEGPSVEGDELSLEAAVRELFDADIVCLVGHGEIDGSRNGQVDDSGSFQIRFGSDLVFDRELLPPRTRSRAYRQKLVFLVSCKSGHISRSNMQLIDSIRALGVRAMVVTEAEIDEVESAKIVYDFLDGLLGGKSTTESLISLRAKQIIEKRRMDAFSYTALCPPGFGLPDHDQKPSVSIIYVGEPPE